MSRIIVDTSFLVGLMDDKDRRRAQILRIPEVLEQAKWEIVLFDCVFNEVISVLAKRLEEKRRSSELPALMDKVERFAKEQGIQWLYPDLPDKIWDVFDSVGHYKGSLSFHDALIALAAKETSLQYIVSFDRDFDEVKWLIRVEDEKDLVKVETP